MQINNIMYISHNDLIDFDTNKSEFFNKYNGVPKHILLGLSLNSAISLNLTLIIDKILTIVEDDYIKDDYIKDDYIEDDYIDYVPIIFTINDSTGFNVLSSLLTAGDTNLLNKIISMIKKIKTPIKKINCSQSELQHFDTFLRCIQFDNIDLIFLIDNLIRPFYTEKSIDSILSFVNDVN
jgi:hypothetical protein